jgi:hypothetical protein
MKVLLATTCAAVNTRHVSALHSTNTPLPVLRVGVRVCGAGAEALSASAPRKAGAGGPLWRRLPAWHKAHAAAEP